MIKKVAAAGTLIFHAAIVVVLMMLCLEYPGHEQEQNRQWPPVDSSLLLFGGEYVAVGEPDAPDLAEPAMESEPMVESEAEASRTTAQDAMVSTTQPSPMKAEKVDKPKHKEQKKEVDQAVNAQKQHEETKRKEIAAKMGKTFAGMSGTSLSSARGQEDGTAATGAASGTPGHNLKGRTLEHFDLPPRAPLGTVTVRISVDRQGKVTSATYASGTGQAGASEKARRGCVAAALRSSFSVEESAPVSQTGTITYRFR